MPKYTQAKQPMEVQTPLGTDAVLLTAFRGREALSELFRFELDLLAPRDNPVAFDKLLGQAVTVRLTLADNSKRFFHGIVRRLTQGHRDPDFIAYKAEVVPQFWLWTKRVQTRTFQALSVPAILKEVLQGLDVRFQLAGTYYPRDYCVQYNESDFAFASRLMEEEGIGYFFQHAEGKHTLVIADSPAAYPEVPVRPAVIFDEVQGGTRPEVRVTGWAKSQELRSGKYTLWDHCFELPGNTLEAQQPILDQVAAGKVNHTLKAGANGKLEVYEYPGRYAQRFDGLDRGGGDRAADLQKIFEDNKRTAKVRMEQEALPGLVIDGAGNCGQFVPGHRFTLQRHFDADGEYVLTRVQHTAQLGDAYRTGEVRPLAYENRFGCIPTGLPYRPARVTPKPTLTGPQTAVVVGPPGEEIFCDKYGRVKVQFPWDRLGKKNADSSCWLRVGQFAAGKGFGALNLPRIGQEVIVSFLEGDPDQPIVVGVVYNAENMPPYKLPEQRTFSGMVHRSHGGVAENANEIRFENQLGQERMLLHSETDLHTNVENNQHVQVGKFHSEVVGRKVKWDKGSLNGAKRATAQGSGSGGGPGDWDPKAGGGFEAPATAPKPAPGQPAPQAGDVTGTDVPFYKAERDDVGKYTEVNTGCDITIDNGGKRTHVRGSNVTTVYGGQYSAIYQKDGPNGTPDAFASTPGASLNMANATDVYGDNMTTVHGFNQSIINGPSYSRISESSTSIIGIASSSIVGGLAALITALSFKLIAGISLSMMDGVSMTQHAGPSLDNFSSAKLINSNLLVALTCGGVANMIGMLPGFMSLTSPSLLIMSPSLDILP